MSTTVATTTSNAEPERSSSDESITRNAAYEVLSCRRRRDVVHCLRRHGGAMELRELSERIAAWENEVSPAEVTYKQRMRVYTTLKQYHLPKMEGANVVDYDDSRAVVRRTEEFEDIECYLDVVPSDDIPWSEYYLGVSVLALVFIGFAWTGFFPLARLSGFGWAGVIALYVGVSALVHRHQERKYRLGSDGPPPEHR